MQHGAGGDPFAGLKEAHEHYKVFDEHYENVGRVDDLFVDEDDRPLYISLKTGLLGTSSALIPMEILRVNDKRKVVEVAKSGEQIRHAPSFGSGEELTPEMEEKVRVYFGLRGPRTFADHGPHGPAPDGRIDLLPGERKVSEPARTPTPPSDPAVRSGDSGTEPGKEWARGTQGHRVEAEERDGGHRTTARRLRK